jgi:RNA polymerase sigma-70 factor (ECF subfamily)
LPKLVLPVSPDAPDGTYLVMSVGVLGSAAHGAGVADAVDAAVAGRESGWDTLFDRFYPVVLRFAMARLGDQDAAEEVAQEVFVAAVTSIGNLRERREPAVEAWFLRITRFKAIDRLRRGPSADAEVPDDLAARDDPAATATGRVEAGEVRRAMEQLTEDQRDVLIRRFVLDQSLEQVAAGTGRRVGAIKSMQHRALATLAKQLPGREIG